MHNIHCISYASNIFLERKNSFLEEANNFNKFDSVKIYSEKDLDISFIKEFNNVLCNLRGGGYWIWKLQIIKQRLQEINDNDTLFYLDIGCTINTTLDSINTFFDYLKIIKKNTFLKFELNYLEEAYTNKKMLNFFSEKYNINIDKLGKSKQLVGGILGFLKNDKSVSYIEETLSILKEDPLLITDYYNDYLKHPNFIDHRHDQSLMSLLYKCLGYTNIIPDHTWSTNWAELNHVPFLSTRKIV